jgi:hypothetical protein
LSRLLPAPCDWTSTDQIPDIALISRAGLEVTTIAPPKAHGMAGFALLMGGTRRPAPSSTGEWRQNVDTGGYSQGLGAITHGHAVTQKGASA